MFTLVMEREVKLNHQIEDIFEKVKESNENDRRALVLREGSEWLSSLTSATEILTPAF